MEAVFKFIVELLEKHKNQIVYDREIKTKAGSFHMPMSSSGNLIEIGVDIQKNFAIFTGKQLCYSLFLIKLQSFKPATLLKETPTQVLSCEYYEIFKNNCFYRTPTVAASEY